MSLADLWTVPAALLQRRIAEGGDLSLSGEGFYLRELDLEGPVCIGPVSTLSSGPAFRLAGGRWLLARIATSPQSDISTAPQSGVRELLCGFSFPHIPYLRAALAADNWREQLAKYTLDGAFPVGAGSAYGLAEEDLIPTVLREIRESLAEELASLPAEQQGFAEEASLLQASSLPDEELLRFLGSRDLFLYFTDAELQYRLKLWGNEWEHIAFALFSSPPEDSR
jgi:hypothetical protein